MSSSLPGSNNSSNSGRLNGWKEISAYLQKSVRTVQRWEKDLQLPVHRIHGNGGEIVFAQVNEIEAWLHGTRQERLADAKENESGEHVIQTAPSSAAPAPPISKHWRWVAIVSTAALITLSATWALMLGTAPSTPSQTNPTPLKIADWKVESGVFVALGATSQKLWEHRQDPPLQDDFYQSGTRDQAVVTADVDGDGADEVLLIAQSKRGSTLRVLEATGKQRFELTPQHEKQFGKDPQGPPWTLTGVFAVRNPDGTADIWLRMLHHVWYPSALLKLDRRNGNVLSEYWSSGHITAYREATVNGRRVMFVGATNNDSKGASLAVLDYANANGFSPTLNSRYGCTACASGGLLHFYLFPQMELSHVMQSRPNVNFVRLDGSGNPLIDVQQADGLMPPKNDHYVGATFYALTSDFRVSEAETGDSYRQVHAMLELLGKINHPFGLECEKQLYPVLRWNGHEFVEETATLGSPPRGVKPIVASQPSKGRLSPAAFRR